MRASPSTLQRQGLVSSILSVLFVFSSCSVLCLLLRLKSQLNGLVKVGLDIINVLQTDRDSVFRKKKKRERAWVSLCSFVSSLSSVFACAVQAMSCNASHTSQLTGKPTTPPFSPSSNFAQKVCFPPPPPMVPQMKKPSDFCFALFLPRLGHQL